MNRGKRTNPYARNRNHKHQFIPGGTLNSGGNEFDPREQQQIQQMPNEEQFQQPVQPISQQQQSPFPTASQQKELTKTPLQQEPEQPALKQKQLMTFSEFLEQEAGKLPSDLMDGVENVVKSGDLNDMNIPMEEEDNTTRNGPPGSKKLRVLNRAVNKIKPKSATAILNEMSSAHSFRISCDERGFQAVLQIDNLEFGGLGQSKTAAQTAAAEAAIKHIVLTSDMQQLKAGEIGMLNYPQLLSYALYKLLLSWDNSGTCVNRVQASHVGGGTAKPTKKFPPNPELVHPVMLLSQTHPYAKFVEIGSCPPPTASFTIACVIDDKQYIGTGPNKKDAKKRAAMQACQEIFDLKYPDIEENENVNKTE